VLGGVGCCIQAYQVVAEVACKQAVSRAAESSRRRREVKTGIAFGLRKRRPSSMAEASVVVVVQTV